MEIVPGCDHVRSTAQRYTWADIYSTRITLASGNSWLIEQRGYRKKYNKQEAQVGAWILAA